MRPAPEQRFLIVTADDFGRDPAVNCAVQQAASHGILTAASLMVGAAASDEAVALARTLPQLRVGLHLVLTDDRAVLPPDRLPDLLDASGRFRHSMVQDAFRMALRARVRRQIAAEVRAQFEAFRATGLTLDHVNAHKHFHIHPQLLEQIVAIGAEYGLTAVRLPREPLWFAARQGPVALAASVALRPWLLLMQRRLRAQRLICNQAVFGIACSGAFDETTLLQILARLPSGITEIYLHPTLAPEGIPGAELAALTSGRVRDAVARCQIARGGYQDLGAASGIRFANEQTLARSEGAPGPVPRGFLG